mgnify:CR=1 FL=1
MTVKTTFAVSAFIDLLGFSNHLMMANYDTRTSIGELAVKRLQNLVGFLKEIDEEEKKYPQCYPTVKINRSRFNDAIYLTMELSEVINTTVGEHEWKGWSAPDINKFMETNNISKEEFSEAGTKELAIQSENVAKFLGLVARLHISINRKELNDHFPGAKTVVSTGLKLSDDKNPLDAFSANFSLSNAYLVGEKGSGSGFGGNKFYVEDNLARIVCLDDKYLSLMRQSNFVYNLVTKDPYSGNPLEIISQSTDFQIARKIEVDLFGKKYQYRELNVNPMSWVQSKIYVDEILGVENITDDNLKTIYKQFDNEAPSIDNIKGNRINECPFIFIGVIIGPDAFRF